MAKSPRPISPRCGLEIFPDFDDNYIKHSLLRSYKHLQHPALGGLLKRRQPLR
jgi:hypothetical protein